MSKMKIVKANDVPIYEVTCEECKSVIRYKACEVAHCHITCPVCGVSLWVNTVYPVTYESQEISRDLAIDDKCQQCVHFYEEQIECHYCHVCEMEHDCFKPVDEMKKLK